MFCIVLLVGVLKKISLFPPGFSARSAHRSRSTPPRTRTSQRRRATCTRRKGTDAAVVTAEIEVVVVDPVPDFRWQVAMVDSGPEFRHDFASREHRRGESGRSRRRQSGWSGWVEEGDM